MPDTPSNKAFDLALQFFDSTSNAVLNGYMEYSAASGVTDLTWQLTDPTQQFISGHTYDVVPLSLTINNMNLV
jgi:hypothetical protein